MKNLFLLTCSMAFIFVFSTNTMSFAQNTSEENSILVWTSPDLFEITSTWVSAYSKNNPEAKIKVSSTHDANITDKIKTSGSIGFITPDQLDGPEAETIWRMVVGRDIIVPVMNPENPFYDEIYSKGISSKDFANVYTDRANQTWGTLLNNDQTKPLNCYCIEDESIRAHLTEFLQSDITNIYGSDVANADEMLEKIKKDKYAIGFCRLVNILDFEKNELKEGISLIPIDINENNKVDYFEDIYNNPRDFERGIWIGKYPKVLFSSILMVADEQPVNNMELAFLEWVLTEGQQYLNASGYSELLLSERLPKVQSLYANQIPIADIHNKPLQSTNILFVLLIMLGGSFMIFLSILIVRNLKTGNQEFEADAVRISSVLGEHTVEIPGGLFFDKSHTWAFMEKDGFVRIGVDDFLQKITGTITKVKMKAAGEKIKKGETFLSLIQHGKQLNIQSPVSGIIKENNSRLNSNSSIINSSPYTDGWIYVIESPNWLKETKSFFMGETYRQWLKNEFARLKDFLATLVTSGGNPQVQLVMQDGGEMKERLLECLGPEEWEEFQTKFINLSK